MRGDDDDDDDDDAWNALSATYTDHIAPDFPH